MFNPVEKNLRAVLYGARKNPLVDRRSAAGYDVDVVAATEANIEATVIDGLRAGNILSESDRLRGPQHEMISTCGSTHPLKALLPILEGWDPDVVVAKYFKNGLDITNSPRNFPRTSRTLKEHIAALKNGMNLGEHYDVEVGTLDPHSHLIRLTRKGVQYQPTQEELQKIGMQRHLYLGLLRAPAKTLDNDAHLDALEEIIEGITKHPDINFARKNFHVDVEGKIMEGKSLVVLYPKADFGYHESPEPHYMFKSMNLSTDDDVNPLDLLVPAVRHHVVGDEKPAALVARYFADPYRPFDPNGDLTLARAELERLGYQVTFTPLASKKFGEVSVEFRIAAYDDKSLTKEQIKAFLDRYDTSTLVPEPELVEATRPA